ncbi:hypothetical protein PF005_g25872 [Phytophthora fragariae]|nr:hypothetical protein PF009_g26154 [Phytophthora fragariae]KAE9074470.1 hypothetical protein PF007_g25394 [Phytophthora fragariae]KAE9174399.1 hypothetical protein PF005_g25872 [Phytophthora fragariae]KAE9272537.1 hypothetical protein PF001_g27895 [Phytophthora fragariae]
MESSGAEGQASESVDSAGVTIKTDESAEPVLTDDSKGEADSAVTADAGSEEAAVVSGRSRVREAEDSISELTQLLDNARKLSAELETRFSVTRLKSAMCVWPMTLRKTSISGLSLR